MAKFYKSFTNFKQNILSFRSTRSKERQDFLKIHDKAKRLFFNRARRDFLAQRVEYLKKRSIL